MRSAMLAFILTTTALSAPATGASAQSSEGAASEAPEVREVRTPPRRCPPARGRTHCARAKVAALAPATAPMLPPLGGRVWLHEDPPLFDPYESAGPYYKPWVHAGTQVVQWRYGFPGGHVDWYRGLGWRPGFGWF
ncbi:MULTISPECIES: hypothetical protein [Methylosinus]|uniref:YXWGXW repeat-containing protein n=1 Tax=Methylosinus trichosporium (strain ATCC 35070 / NCIMB 11131 / UNIQEM 75 / OB3b) TaxID=595536 RepID=A0A2D2D143_METT3|nr:MULTISPECIES: hypothetical protein [Methylosinus]ATQ68674.1 hypothetical protein CQW49_12865 [Methylosinus trichosporium OB3b]OBS53162.1 hypothetical protein A8B73_07655 [Methylosinus sp. 3S-1]